MRYKSLSRQGCAAFASNDDAEESVLGTHEENPRLLNVK